MSASGRSKLSPNDDAAASSKIVAINVALFLVPYNKRWAACDAHRLFAQGSVWMDRAPSP